MAEKNWTIKIPSLKGVAPADLAFNIQGPIALKARVVGSTQKENGNVMVDVMITEKDSDYEGVLSQITLGTDWSKPFNIQKWKQAVISMGVPASELESDEELIIEAKHLLGRDCYCFFGPLPEEGAVDDKGRRVYQQRDFISPERYEQLKTTKLTLRTRTGKASEGNGAKGAAEFVVQQPTSTGPLATRLTGAKPSPFGA